MQTTHKLSVITLVAGLALAAVSGVAFGATDPAQAKISSGSAAQVASDGWITINVTSKLSMTEGLKRADFTVQVNNAKVILTGVLSSKAEIRKAIAVTKSVEGVQSVDANGLTVGPKTK